MKIRALIIQLYRTICEYLCPFTNPHGRIERVLRHIGGHVEEGVHWTQFSLFLYYIGCVICEGFL